jgi:copper resistance protein D
VIGLRPLIEWPLIAALVALFGTTALVLMASEEGFYDIRQSVAPLIPWWRIAALIILVTAPCMMLDVSAKMAGVTWKEALPLFSEVLSETHAGHVWQWYIPGILAIVVIAFFPLRERVRAVALLVLSAVVLFLQAELSHATDKGLLAMLLYFVHEAAAGVWFGALFAFWTVVRRGNPPGEWVGRAALKVSKLAGWAVATLILTGIYTAYHGLGFDLYHLLYSAYGRTLLAKVAVFSLVLPIGAYNRYRLIPEIGGPSAQKSLLHNVGIESLILAVGVLGLAAVLANTPPAHGHMMPPNMQMPM